MSSTTELPNKIDMWVGNLVLALDSRLRFVAAMNAWLFTSLDDAEGDESIRRHPFVRAAAVLDPGVPSLVVAGRALRGRPVVADSEVRSAVDRGLGAGVA